MARMRPTKRTLHHLISYFLNSTRARVKSTKVATCADRAQFHGEISYVGDIARSCYFRICVATYSIIASDILCLYVYRFTWLRKKSDAKISVKLFACFFHAVIAEFKQDHRWTISCSQATKREKTGLIWLCVPVACWIYWKNTQLCAATVIFCAFHYITPDVRCTSGVSSLLTQWCRAFGALKSSAERLNAGTHSLTHTPIQHRSPADALTKSHGFFFMRCRTRTQWSHVKMDAVAQHIFGAGARAVIALNTYCRCHWSLETVT